MCCRRESVRLLLSLVYPFMMPTCLGTNFQLEQLMCLCPVTYSESCMIYKQLVLWMTHNAIRTPGFSNCWFRVQQSFSENFLLLFCRYLVQYLEFQQDLYLERKVPWYIQEHALPTYLVKGDQASTI